MTTDKAIETIYHIVDAYRKEKSLLKTDIWQIVHIFDTDGTYIPDSAAVKGDTPYFVYSTTQIRCNDTKKILVRNKLKRTLMDDLLNLHDIKGIPYIGYFMSSNLDHALYNEQNLALELKNDYADAFYSEFAGKEELFIDYLKSEVANGVPDKFPASWKYIKEDLHSLERHSNLHIYFELNPPL